jgi:hypothetical protein
MSSNSARAPSALHFKVEASRSVFDKFYHQSVPSKIQTHIQHFICISQTPFGMISLDKFTKPCGFLVYPISPISS